MLNSANYSCTFRQVAVVKTDNTWLWQTAMCVSHEVCTTSAYKQRTYVLLYFCYKVAIKSCLHKISLLPSRFKLKDLLLWQQVQNELRRTKQSKIMTNRQQSNPANWVSDVRRTGLRCPSFTKSWQQTKSSASTKHFLLGSVRQWQTGKRIALITF